MTDADRLERAFTDVVAVEQVAPGLCKVVTFGGAYTVDAREGRCTCPDEEYNEPEGGCKHRQAARFALGTDDVPHPALVTDDLSTRVVADGGREHPDAFEVVDHDNGNRRPADSKAQAEDMAETAREFGSEHVEVLAPQQTDGGEAVPVNEDAPELPDKQLSEDPISWVPDHFVDEIEGVPTINRKGYAVIAEHYGIDVTREFVTYPSESDFKYAEAEATATTEDGATYSGFGSAHVKRGDDSTLLGELSETRAMKRAVAWATGVGMTAVSELQNELPEA